MIPKPPPMPIRVDMKYLDLLYKALCGEKKKEAQRDLSLLPKRNH